MTEESKEYPVWEIVQTGFELKNNLSKETLFSVGNGYMAARAYTDEPFEADMNTTHRGTYFAGVFNRGPHGLYDMVNMPSYFECDVVLDGTPMRITPENVEEYTRRLDMKTGTYTRSFVFTAADGKKTHFKSVRLTSLDNVHIAAQKVEVTPLNWGGPAELKPTVNGDTFNFFFIGKTEVTNPEKVRHLEAGCNELLSATSALMSMKTTDTQMEVAYATAIKAVGNTGDISFSGEGLSQQFCVPFEAAENETVSVERVIAVYTSRESESVCDDAKALLGISFDEAVEKHVAAWAGKWEQCDVLIDGPSIDQQAVRFNVFQLIQSNSENDPQVNIPPRGLFGERYRGGAFWDTEIYMLPFFELTNPKAAANLLEYRYHRLPGAKAKAKKYLFKGAMIPWVSSHDGLEQCPGEEFTFYEIHVTCDVARGVMHYWQTTGDDNFIVRCGAELLIETARFWESRVSWSRRKQKYVLMHVIGPDEFCGRNGNNTYTNMMVVENFKGAIQAIELLKEKGAWDALKAKTGFDDAELETWNDIVEKMYINYWAEEKLYMQDDDFDDLPELNVMPYRAMGGAGQESIPHSCWEMHKVVKQPDIVLLMYLLSDRFSKEEKQAAWDYYEHRTLHSSSLSYAVHSILAAELGIEDIAVDYYRRSARIDIDDAHNNTGHGLHTPAAGGSWQVLIGGFAGLRVLEDRLLLQPKMPAIWNGLTFKVLYKGWNLAVEISKEGASVAVSGSGLPGAKLDLSGQIVELTADAEFKG